MKYNLLKNIAKHDTVALWYVVILCCSFTTVAEVKAGESSNSIFIDTQSYGEYAHRDTNFTRDDYSAIAGWAELRVILRYKGNLKSATSRTLYFEPYFKGTIAASERSSYWENNLIYGVGLENRFMEPFIHNESGLTGLVKKLRLYIEYLKTSYTKDSAGDDIPDHDIRLGVDLWKEWNIPPNPRQSNVWGEVWANAGWRETNFNASDYKSYICGAMSRIGVKPFDPIIHTSSMTADILPYIMVETSITGKDNYWENGLFAGVGVRFMSSLKVSKKEKQQLIIKLFVEWLSNIDYYKGNPEPETPDHDLRIGLNYSYNLY